MAITLCWVAFFVLLIFKPQLAWNRPWVGILAVAGVGWWMYQAYRTRKAERADMTKIE